MNCEECRELMLEAEPELLAGKGDASISAHIRSCDGCQELASAILGRLQPARLAYARIEPLSLPRRRAVRFMARRAMWAAVSLAAAAAIVIMVSNAPGEPRQHLIARNLETDASAAPTIAVEVPEGRNAIVFGTNNPKVSVVWIY